MEGNELALVWQLCPGVGPVRWEAIVETFGDGERAWAAGDVEWLERGFTERWVVSLRRYQGSKIWEKTLGDLQRLEIAYVPAADICYPERLRQIQHPPMGLFVRSKVEMKGLFDDRLCVAVVGTRKMTGYGKYVAEWFSGVLAEAGLGIVSGLMYGVDEAAHLACIEYGGKTIGVWAGGIDTLFGGSRSNLAKRVLDSGGALVSEYPPGIQPNQGTFPARNRVVAGLCAGVLVVEGSASSGTLITAGFAAELGRDVWAVPGPITSLQSIASAQLIKSGAELVTNPEEILTKLGAKMGKQSQDNEEFDSLGPEQKVICELLVREPRTFDELRMMSGLEITELGTWLSVMELEGRLLREGELWMVCKRK